MASRSQIGSGRSRVVCMAALLALAIASILPAAAGARPGQAKESRVRVATSGDFSERLETLSVGRSPASGGEVVMSLTPKRLPSVREGDRLEISTELQVTVDCRKPSARCIGHPYDYNPDIELQLILGSSASDAGGPGAIAVGAPRHEICRQRLPDREHHCVIVFERTLPRLSGSAPCLAHRCFVNLVAAASDSRARQGDYVAVGGLRPNGSVPQDRSRLNVVRVHPAGKLRSKGATATARVEHRLHLDQRREVIYSQRLRGLSRGEQLVVDATARVDIGALPYNVVLSSQLILTDRPGATDRGLAKSVASMRGEFDEGNGFNCTQNLGTCTIQKVGVIEMKRSATRAGRPADLYATLVTRAGPKHLEARTSDRVEVLQGGGLTVDRYAASVRG